VLGATGSVGAATLDVIERHPERFEVVALTAQRRIDDLLAQCVRWRPRFAAVATAADARTLTDRLRDARVRTEVLAGPQALCELAAHPDVDTVMAAIVGAAGLAPCLAAAEAGKRLLLANKEALVLGAELFTAAVRRGGATLLPIDSEHSAIFQCLRGEDVATVRRIVLTASGGPFRRSTRGEIASATPEMALRHPNWSMGPRITIGSATLMNKALEVIELHHLFGIDARRIEVVIHPQSIVHSLVEFVDGSVIAQMGPPDMRGPIHYALHHPQRTPADLKGFDVDLFRTLTFEKPDRERFPALELGYRCVEQGSDSGAVLNAADEVAVEAFLAQEIGFDDIVRINAEVLARRPGLDRSVTELLRADAHARELARAEIRALVARA
jgi:1-deoxy-D-xylulose-5-phosphate reductoisomerase